MNKHLYSCLLILFLTGSSDFTLAQSARKIPADKQRALQWKPDKGQYYFSHSMVMHFENKDKLWITAMPFSIYPLYGFELIEAAASLPASFDYLYLRGPYQLLSEMNSKDPTLKLTNIGQAHFLLLHGIIRRLKSMIK